MTIKMLFLSSFGGIKPTSKVEAEHARLLAAYNEFCCVEKSDELKNYIELEKFVRSEAFAQKKKAIENLKFRGSEEETRLKEFESLSKNRKLKSFFNTEKSPELERFNKLKSSDKLVNFRSLKKFMEEGEFQSEKKKSDFETFKGSSEEKQLKEFHVLQKSKAIKTYFSLNTSSELKQHLAFAVSADFKKFTELKEKLEKSKILPDEKKEFDHLRKSAAIKAHLAFAGSGKYKLYKETDGSPYLKQFENLQQITLSEAFLKRKVYLEDRKKFEKTEAFKKSQEYGQLKTSDDIRFYFSFEKSSAYKNFLLMNDLIEKKRFFELKTLTESKDFIERKAYLEDQKKWEKTEEYRKLQEYNIQKQLPHLLNYFKYKDSKELDFFKQWNLVFEDTFSNSKLDNTKWQTISYQANQALGRNYSQFGDLQAFTSGENIKTDGKCLKIETRKEKIFGMQWHMPFGFHEQEFNYSSGIVCTGDLFKVKYGILEAKVKYQPQQNMASVLYLLGQESSPQINLVETGVKNRVSLLSTKDGHINEQSENISGLKTGQFYIFRLEWSEKQLIWKINGKEIYSVDIQVPDTEMHLNAATVVVDEVSEGLPYQFEIDWIRYYQPVKN